MRPVHVAMMLIASGCGIWVGNPKKPTGGSGGKGAGAFSIAALLPADTADTVVPVAIAGKRLQPGAPQPVVAGSLEVVVPRASALTGDGGVGAATALMVMWEQASKLDTFDTIRFIAAPTAGDVRLLSFLADEATVERLELGAVSADESTGELVSGVLVGTAQFAVAATQLTELATIDDGMRAVKNQFVNGDAFVAADEFGWEGALLPALNAETAPEALRFAGWSPALSIHAPGITFEALCDPSSPEFRELRFEAPGDGVTRADFEPMKVITNAGATINDDGRSCNAGYLYVGRHEEDPTRVGMNFGGGNLFTSVIPAGAWQLFFDGELRAKFDLAMSHPLIPAPDDATKLVPRVYVPSLRVVTDPATHQVQAIELWFYVYDRATRSYRRVTDYSVMKAHIDWASFTLMSRYDAALTDTLSHEASYTWPPNDQPKTLVRAAMTHDWRLDADDDYDCERSDGGRQLTSIDVQYIMYGNRYGFTFAVPRVAATGAGCGEPQ
jgi:hypothetical protein